ncbi:MAG: VPLPA-CTERM sorting domain-containing protein [Bdellovibrionales bacterium]
MSKFKFLLPIAAAAILFSGAAHAATITITLGAVNSYASGGTLVGNIDLDTTSMLTLTPNATIVPAGVTYAGVTVSPSVPLFGDSYLYVPGAVGSSATFTLTADSHVFGLRWGTIDSYNTLNITDSNGNAYQIKGSEILTKVSGLTSGSSELDVLVVDPTGFIKTVVLLSTQNSFEAGEFYAAPLPPAVLLFASGLIGLGGIARRKRN